MYLHTHTHICAAEASTSCKFTHGCCARSASSVRSEWKADACKLSHTNATAKPSAVRERCMAGACADIAGAAACADPPSAILPRLHIRGRRGWRENAHSRALKDWGQMVNHHMCTMHEIANMGCVAAKSCPPLRLPCCRGPARDHILRLHARTFAITHLKTRRIVRPGAAILRTATVASACSERFERLSWKQIFSEGGPFQRRLIYFEN